MSAFPTRRLLAAGTIWLVAAVLATAWVPLLAPLLAAFVLLAGLLAWDAWLLARRPLLAVEREIPARAVIDRPDTIAYRIDNPSAETVTVALEDEWPPDVAGTEPRVAELRIPGHSTHECRFSICPQRRGDRLLGNLLLFEESPLRFLRRRQVVNTGAVLSVYPDARRLAKAAALDPRQLLGHAGLRPTARRGQGSDFESLRDYVVGDDPRHIDWAATARRGELVTRLYQRERHHTIVLAVDCSRLMGASCSDQRTKLDHAVDAALTLSLAALARGDRVEVLLFDREIRGHVAPRAHRREVGPVVELLRHAEPASVEADYPKLVRALLARRRGRALVVLLTDFAEAESADIEAPLRLLRRHYRTLLVALRDPLFAHITSGAVNPGDEFYERLAINELLNDREAALARLQSAAVQSIDLPPEHIVAPLLNRYLEFRYSSV